LAPLGPDSLSWERVGDLRGMLVAGRALMLQVAHPVVAGGVDGHSNFAEDPWGRLRRTIDAVITFTYGGPEAIRFGQALRRMHGRIKGVDWAGRSYHAHDPEAYAWVHATLYEGGRVMCEHFGPRIPAGGEQRFYDEWLQIGRLLRVPEGRLPPDLEDFDSYFEEMIDERLEDNRVVREVLAAISSPAPPPHVPRPVWLPARVSGGHVTRLVTIGLLPPRLRERWDLEWTPRQQRELRAFTRLVRRVAPRVPERLRFFPEAYAARRRADAVPGPATTPIAA
jgi:uncharacterized protein (DUF2236 family)